MSNDILTPRPSRPTMIKGLVPTLPERGHIKIGIKGDMKKSRNGTSFQPPQKLDHFVVTGMDRGEDGNFRRDETIHKLIGDKPKEIPVRLLYDDPTLNFPTRYACYNGRTLWCSGDGETATRVNDDGHGYDTVKCTCQRSDPAYQGKDRCKMNGSLSALIDGAGGLGGVWKFRTTSYNSIVGILSSLSFLRSLTGGPLANIPFKLKVRPKQGTAPDGSSVTVYVVSIEFDGEIAALQSHGHKIALERATTHMSIVHIEDEARRLLSIAPPNAPLPGDDTDEIVEEFYPEQIAPKVAPPRPTRGKFTPIPVPDVEAEPYTVATEDGELLEFGNEGDAIAEFGERLAAVARISEAALHGLWESNGLILSQLRERGFSDQADELGVIFAQLADNLKPAAQVDLAPETTLRHPEPFEIMNEAGDKIEGFADPDKWCARLLETIMTPGAQVLGLWEIHKGVAENIEAQFPDLQWDVRGKKYHPVYVIESRVHKLVPGIAP